MVSGKEGIDFLLHRNVMLVPPRAGFQSRLAATAHGPKSESPKLRGRRWKVLITAAPIAGFSREHSALRFQIDVIEISQPSLLRADLCK